jgi:uncharacterized protein (DUF2062 family)
VSNTLSVSALPSRSSFTVGVYRSVLVASSALVSAGVGALVHIVSLQTVILMTLAVPLSGGVVVAALFVRRIRRTVDPPRSLDAAIPLEVAAADIATGRQLSP